MTIGVIGLWHLGCVITASWLKLGFPVVAVDFEEELVDCLLRAEPPIYEPGLQELFATSLEEKKVLFSTDPSSLAQCQYVFLAYDTPVDEQDQYDLMPLQKALMHIGPVLRPGTLVIVSSQIPVGTAQTFREQLQKENPDIELVYSPENLRLGEAVSNYLHPGHIVIGGEKAEAIQQAVSLFSSIQATYLPMNLVSAEMTKHALNAFLATSITFANQLNDACKITGAHFLPVVAGMKMDPRIGQRAYLKAGIGFSGGTLGRDLHILEEVNQKFGGNVCPLFGDVWQYNRLRATQLCTKVGRALGVLEGKTIAILGMTYKPGTSTLRRSTPLEIARSLACMGAVVRVHDPKADWSEGNMEDLEIYTDPYRMALHADLLLLLTEWPQFQQLDLSQLARGMNHKKLYDPHYFLTDQVQELTKLGFEIL